MTPIPAANATRERPILVLGAGPAGLTAGYLLAKEGLPVVVVEAEWQVGGIAKTEVRDGYRFDLGGHRFFTKVDEVNELWFEIMREEFLLRPRMSRIYWNGKFLDYPLQGMDVVKKLGPIELTRSGLSYVAAKVRPKGEEDEPRAVGLQPLRQAPVRALLQVLHREGVGRPVHRDPLGVGGPAHQGPVVLERGQVRLPGQQGQQDQVADQRVPLPALRPRADVGDDDRRHPPPRRRRAPRRPGLAHPGQRRGPDHRGPGQRLPHPALARDQLAAAARHRRLRPARARASACSTPPPACATATSSPSRS